MIELIAQNRLAFALVLGIGLLVAFWLLARRSAPPARSHRPDVLDEGAAPAARNQALIDAPSAVDQALGVPLAITPTPTPEPEPASPPPAPAEPIAEPPAEPAAPPSPPTPAPPPPSPAADDLSRIKGLGPKLQALLPTLGLATYAQIAALSEADLADLDTKLGAFAGRPARDKWVEQARYLAAGDIVGFEAAFGKV